MNTKIFCFAAALMTMSFGSASADIVTVTVTGEIKSGIDLGGIFGPAGTDMTGDPYSIVYTINTSSAPHSLDVPPIQYGVEGGGAPYPPTPAFQADVTVNGQMLNPSFNAGHSLIYCEGCYSIFVSSNEGFIVDRLEVTDSYFSISTLITGALPLTDTTPFSYTLNPATDSSSGDIYQAYGSFTDLSLSVSNITLANDAVSVPTPIAGAGLPGMTFVLGVAGLLGWRRKRSCSSGL
jgi:hypothetical protein